jgi:hypothetical protein
MLSPCNRGYGSSPTNIHYRLHRLGSDTSLLFPLSSKNRPPPGPTGVLPPSTATPLNTSTITLYVGSVFYNGFGGLGAGPSCGGARSIYNDELPQRQTSTEPLYMIANALPDYDTFRGDPSLVQATRDCFNENINSLFDHNPADGTTSTYRSRPELKELRKAFQSTAGYFRETVDMISDRQEARRMVDEIMETLLSRVRAVPSMDGRYTEYDPWADSPPVSSKSKLPSLTPAPAPAPTATFASYRSQYIPNDYMPVDPSAASPMDALSAQQSPSLLSHNHSRAYPATAQRSTWMSDTTRPDTAFVSAIGTTSPGSKVLGKLSWIPGDRDTLASETECQTLAISSDFGTGSTFDSYSPRKYAVLDTSQLSFTKGSRDDTVASSASSWQLGRGSD